MVMAKEAGSHNQRIPSMTNSHSGHHSRAVHECSSKIKRGPGDIDSGQWGLYSRFVGDARSARSELHPLDLPKATHWAFCALKISSTEIVVMVEALPRQYGPLTPLQAVESYRDTRTMVSDWDLWELGIPFVQRS